MRIKEVVEILDPTPLIDRRMLELTRWLADYYACSWGQALDAAVPAGVKKHAGTRVGTFLVVPEETREALRARAIEPQLSAKQAAALEVLAADDEPLTMADVCRLAKCGPVPGPGAPEAGIGAHRPASAADGPGRVAPPATRERRGRRAVGGSPPRRRRPPVEAADRPALVLTDEQSATLARIEPALESGGFAPFLIHGVTGSGKTEVYLSAIERVVARGQEAIVLVPEISLTPQTIRRFRRRFGRVAVLHSHLSDAERHRHWQSIASGEIQVVVGVRSAVFAPARKLGLIVIDEEHESTFKQETTPRYHARDVAVKRAADGGHPDPAGLGHAVAGELAQRRARAIHAAVDADRASAAGRCPRSRSSTCGTRRRPLGGLSESLRQAMIRALQERRPGHPAPESSGVPHVRHLPEVRRRSSSATPATWPRPTTSRGTS